MSLALTPAPEERAEAVIAPTHADGIWSSRLADWLTYGLYWGVHVAAFGVFFTGVTRTALVLFALTFWGRLFGITGGYHRYFSHRTYKTSRAFQFVLALLGTMATRRRGRCGGPRIHRIHHQLVGRARRPPLAGQRGFWWSHMGWILDKKWQGDAPRPDPRLREVPRAAVAEPLALRPARRARGRVLRCRRHAGPRLGLLRLDHAALARHLHDQLAVARVRHAPLRRPTTTRRNNWLLALLTLRRGLAQQPPPLQRTARQGFFWWEIDLTYYVLRGLKAVGLIWDLREPPAALKSGRVREAAIEREAA